MLLGVPLEQSKGSKFDLEWYLNGVKPHARCAISSSKASQSSDTIYINIVDKLYSNVITVMIRFMFNSLLTLILG